MERALEAARLRRQVEQLSAEVRGKWSAHGWVAESPVMREVVRQTLALADTNATVLIRGASGTGKELVARALHADGPRANGPFVAVNCAAFAESLLESELFGHEKGSFTGAVTRRAGAFELAEGGTLFLDEIGDAPPAVQVKLLRVLEDREIMRVGGQKSFRVDVRLVSATNRDLDERVTRCARAHSGPHDQRKCRHGALYPCRPTLSRSRARPNDPPTGPAVPFLTPITPQAHSPEAAAPLPHEFLKCKPAHSFACSVIHQHDGR